MSKKKELMSPLYGIPGAGCYCACCGKESDGDCCGHYQPVTYLVL